jgi:hypothetical protein
MINTGYPVILVIAEGGTTPKTDAAPVSDYDQIGTSRGDAGCAGRRAAGEDETFRKETMLEKP